MAFVLKERISFGSFSEDWKECYIEHVAPDYAKVQEMQAIVAESLSKGNENESFSVAVKFIEDLFVSGKGFDGEKVVDLTKEDIKSLPVKLVLFAVKQISTGGVDDTLKGE